MFLVIDVLSNSPDSKGTPSRTTSVTILLVVIALGLGVIVGTMIKAKR